MGVTAGKVPGSKLCDFVCGIRMFFLCLSGFSWLDWTDSHL